MIGFAILDEALQAIAHKAAQIAIPLRPVEIVRHASPTIDLMPRKPDGLAEIIPGLAVEQPCG